MVIFLSSTSNVAVLTVVLVPLTVKLPVTVKLPDADILVEVISSDVNVPSTWTLLNCTFEVVPTAWPILIWPFEIVTPVPADIWALTSAALGPVYVITPLLELYANEPSPPESVTDIAALASESVYCVIVVEIAPVPELYDIPVPADIAALASALVK